MGAISTDEHRGADGQPFTEDTLEEGRWTDVERETLRRVWRQLSRCVPNEIEPRIVQGERGAWIVDAKPAREGCCPFSVWLYPDDEIAEACNCLVSFTAGAQAFVNLPDAIKPWPGPVERIPEIIDLAVGAVLEGKLYEKLYYVGDRLRRFDFELPTTGEALGCKCFPGGFFLFARLKHGQSISELRYDPYRLQS